MWGQDAQMSIPIVIATVAFLGILGIVWVIRFKFAGEFRIRVLDVIVASVPLLIVGVVTGYISSIDILDGGLKVSLTDKAFHDAGAKPVESQVTGLKIASVNEVLEELDTAEKTGTREIPRLITEGKDSLTFVLGQSGYYAPAMRQYLTTLIQYPFFDYVVFNNMDGTLFGVADARVLTAFMEAQGDDRWASFRDALVYEDNETIRALPGFVDGMHGISADANTRDALQIMASIDADWLPVTHSDGLLAGIVQRSRLTTKLILDVTLALAVLPEPS